MQRSIQLVALVALLTLPVSPAIAISPDQVKVKKVIADAMTPEELAAYKVVLAERYNRGLFDRAQRPSPIFTPGDNCPAAVAELGTLPYNTPIDTTVGMTDDYDLPADTTSPTCTAASACVGAGPPSSLPAGGIYTGTGTAPDKAYQVFVDSPCTLTVTMTPTTGEDLALIVYQSQCSSNLADCTCVDDTGGPGVAESISLSAVPGNQYFIVIDGYSSGGQPPGPAGSFFLALTGTGCQVPVELQSFDVERR